MLTKAFPQKDILSKRGDASLFPIAAKYFPHVLALNAVYKSSEPPIDNNLEFVRLLNAAGLYALENMVQVDGPELLETGLKVAESAYVHDPEEARMLIIYNISPLQVYCQYFGDSGRKRAYELTSRQLDLTRDQLNRKPEDDWSTINFVLLGMVLVNKGCTLAQFNRMKEAGEQYDEALAAYQKAGDETTLAGRIGMTYSFQLWAAATSQRVERARDLAERCVRVVLGAFGAENALTLQTKFCTAVSLFTIGDVSESLRLHKEVYTTRLRISAKSHHAVLASQYNLAVAYQNSGDLETAEYVYSIDHSMVFFVANEPKITFT